MNQLAHTIKNKYDTERSVKISVVCKWHGEKKVFASLDGLAFCVDLEFFIGPVLRELTTGILELFCGHAERLCQSVYVLFLSASTATFFLDEKLGDEAYSCV